MSEERERDTCSKARAGTRRAGKIPVNPVMYRGRAQLPEGRLLRESPADHNEEMLKKRARIMTQGKAGC